MYKYKNQVLGIMKLKHNKFAPTKKSQMEQRKSLYGCRCLFAVCLFIYCLDPVSIEGERVRLDRNSGWMDTTLKGMRVPSRAVSSEVCRVRRREESGSGASGEETAGGARERVLFP